MKIYCQPELASADISEFHALMASIYVCTIHHKLDPIQHFLEQPSHKEDT